MALITVAASGRNDQLGNAKTWYAVDNFVTGERIELRPASDGLFGDLGQSGRFGHQLRDTDGASIGDGGTGFVTWRLGTRSNFAVLSSADIAVLATPIAAFASAGALAAQVVTALQYQRTTVRQNNCATNPPPPRGNGQPVAQLEIVQGENHVFLTQANCVDLGTPLAAIAST
jgi:hypothetical protein